ncbi:MAG: ABC-ATPase UvrA [SAR86 cluster bacterium BACL1 MAG-120920-bin57]|jgi:excinuclease ABC subunit A|uniref:UvrABC system protein A n=2 Tax=SAR86 cluster TaxID=62672 RepID=A0A0R2UGB3_9GAMM|nr:MAG: ABC-ATPase UvrA [SAR86 cluster bacterium BACL1 MAG-120507-bin14]KRO40904.1 MAG: ABC-ATPase UvrA [SAR86 cluster bacterium BACL1 MAG-120920-bin57]KRO96173.1 MAG: ABC-ATPase UvrA [SAR86 cluster bacterium BACL1 MAG-120820-bin45]KRO97521.1 MAG: ABC-ATPase UvrA [SAR86 cluster bacterium BACL1 MAG-120828-bin5]KRO98516.1 MAG: ABC-ATPase UvrA [SAR86 cluster bacterium BACL1 MAG-120823-bin87]KRP00369.1 MAG: ABC-ATPase UvrA [SAR86 cluster bacterium BACL1 MAG-120813-bin36]KRP03093.1 MAG: ABC-ATPase
MDKISIKGARTHNLKNISIEIPRGELVVITGLSGSGKSSLAFDTIYAEGQRRYVESLSSYARQFLSMMEKPDVDQIDGLSPAISIEQKSTSHNPRSTVGTVTEIYDYLRLLYARIGTPICPDHNEELSAKTISEICDEIYSKGEGKKIMVMAPMIRGKKGEHLGIYEELKTEGFVRVKINNVIHPLDEFPSLNKNQKHNISAIVDRLQLKEEEDNRSRLSESIETALGLSNGLVEIEILDEQNNILLFSSNFSCSQCGYSVSDLEPRMFSFNNPFGACEKCDGLGVIQYFDEKKLIADTETTINEGAIKGWNRRNRFYFHQLKCLAKHYKFDLDTPWEEYSEEIQRILLWGSKEKINFSKSFSSGSKIVRQHRFEGVIPNTERRFKETDSEFIRNELAKLLSDSHCDSCEGSRLKKESRNIFINNTPIQDITDKKITDALSFFHEIRLEGAKAMIAEKILKEIKERLTFLEDVGLNYLTLNRGAGTLSGGEAQRIRLASQIGSGLVGVTYVLDEPSIGLHQRDNAKLIKTLFHLKSLGNTVIVVEHDEEAIRCADHIIDIGPGAGKHGGEICAQGSLQDILKSKDSMTAAYLSGRRKINFPKTAKVPEHFIEIQGAYENNLQNISVKIPIGVFTCITGVSGSGKSSLINQTLMPMSSFLLNKANLNKEVKCKQIIGLEHLDKVIGIDQSPIGRTPRSNPATYTGLFSHIRDLFSQSEESRTRGYKPGRFSFNVKGGRCEACQGDGMIKVEMHFLADIYVNCDICNSKRYNEQTLEVKFKGKNIAEVLGMTVEEALEFFAAIPAIKNKLKTLSDVGLTYITLGQSATTLSGGEAQRIKLAKELSKRSTGKTLFILDEPTTGLHFYDVELLLGVLKRLSDQGNTVVVIEHNLDVIKSSDWVIDLGPEGGSDGGLIVAQGTPEKVAQSKKSYTGKYLKEMLGL